MNRPLVSVVIPAYNAAATIDETLQSVVSQTHDALDIIVVDDGSTDGTAAIAARHAAADDRIRVITQANSGVAAARNQGWSLARSDLIAFVDADDLWAPAKIERQVLAMEAGGDKVGLVYCWYAVIDARSIITDDNYRPDWQGEVLDQLFLGNFVGNGSSALVRREALVAARGFEPGLRDAHAQGCEDYLFCCRVAQTHQFALVPDHLVGYRYLPDNMSSDMAKMLRSWLLVSTEMMERHPEKTRLLQEGLTHYAAWLVRRAVYLRQPRQLLALLWLLLRRKPGIAAQVMRRDLPLAVMNLSRGAMQRFFRRQGQEEALAQPRRFPIGTHL